VDPGQVLALAGPLDGVRVAVRVPAAAAADAAAPMAAVRAAGGVPALVLDGVPMTAVERGAAQQAAQVFLDITAETTPADDLAFRLKTRLTELRGSSPATLGLIVTPVQRAELRTRDIVPYVDFIAETVPPGTRVPDWPQRGQAYAAVFRADATVKTPDAPASAWLWRAPADVVDAARLAQDLARARPLLVAELVPGSSVEVFCGGRRAAAYLNPRTLETVAIALGCGSAAVEVKPPASRVDRVTLSTGDVLVRVAAAEGQFADDVSVVGARELSVQEIVARHQAAAARQRSHVATLISTGSMTVTFEAPGFPAPVAIDSETVIYEGLGRTDVEQRAIRVNGMQFTGGGVPRLPIIEPERAASPPLAITLSDLYRYELAGREQLGDTACYVVAFEPVDPKRALFRGRAWIAANGFAMVRVAAVQTGLRGAIVSSEQVDEFAAHGDGVWLLARSEIRQIYEGAAHRTPIHRVLAVRSHEVNAPDFESRRAAAYRSAAIMLRDTPAGFRYLRRDRPTDSAQAAEPVVADAAHRIRTLALGVIVDPNISRPLPFAGLSYVDFNLFGTGTQLNAFFGGTYAQMAFSVPSLAGTRWQLAGRAFAIASSYNDRAFEAGREVYERNITQRPAHASVWSLRPLTDRWTVRAGYELDYTRFRAGDLTSETFAVPANQVAHSLRLAIEGQMRGWNGSIWWSGSRRAGWRRWGFADGDFAPGDADYQRYGVTVTRPFVVTPALVARIEAAWMDGRDLDRFSRYAFGTFDNRLRGYPSALIRYGRGGVVRTAGAWAAGRRIRVDGFLDSAYVHDPGFGPGLRRFTGIGTALEAPAPFGILTAVEWGYGFQGVNASGRRGTQVVRISAFKIF